jgi:hypothetical protein
MNVHELMDSVLKASVVFEYFKSLLNRTLYDHCRASPINRKVPQP